MFDIRDFIRQLLMCEYLDEVQKLKYELVEAYEYGYISRIYYETLCDEIFELMINIALDELEEES